MERTYTLPSTLPLAGALRGIRAAIANIPGAHVTVGAPTRVTVRVHETFEGTYGHRELREVGRYGVDGNPVTVVIPDAALANPGWRIVLRREQSGAGVGERWLDHREDAAARANVRASIPEDPAACDACRKAVRRHAVTVLREEATGRLLQVGGTCEGRYLPATALRILSALSVLEDKVIREERESEGGGGYGFATYLPTADFVSALAATLAEGPYVASRTAAGDPNPRATWRVAWETVERDGPRRSGPTLPAPVLAALRAAEETARFLEADALVSRREAATLAGKVRLALIELERGAARAAAVPVPEGRHTVEGTVVGLKLTESPYGTTLKAIVEVGGGAYKVYGTVPSRVTWDKGDRVRFTATLTRSPGDPYFGWYSRPTVK